MLNWTVNFLNNQKQRLNIDAMTTEFLNDNQGVPQGTALGPVMFSSIINDINTVNSSNDLSKFSNNITLLKHLCMIRKIPLVLKW